MIFIGLVASSTSCKKYLDVNTNPNDVTTATPDLVMPQALTATAGLNQTYQGPTYGMDLGGYIANAGGVGGFGNFWTFQFNNGDANALWTNTFDNLQDYQYIINNTATTGDYKNFNAVARLMKSFDYLKLVDAYGDVPYSQALTGAGKLTPGYDKATDVYKACITEIDAVITQMKVAPTASTVSLASNANGKVDVTVYSGLSTGDQQILSYNSSALLNGKDMTNWIKFANTIKLRAMIRISKSTNPLSAFYNTEKTTMASLTSADFISNDVLVNPGYLQQVGVTTTSTTRQNPLWNALAYNYSGSSATTSYLPSTFVTAFYNGVKLSDPGRGSVSLRSSSGSYIYNNQLGFQSTSLIASPAGGAWYVGLNGGGSPTGLAATGLGIEKGPDQGQPIILATESYFLQAEAALIGLVQGNVKTLFDTGILQSFDYLYKDHTDALYSAKTPGTDATAYQKANATYLANIDQATTDQQRLEAIITQKYIAMNALTSDEGWNDYRRTQYPVSIPTGATGYDASHSFAPSAQTNQSQRTDKLAGRIIYPASEYSLNTANVPVVDPNHSLVFWDTRPTN